MSRVTSRPRRAVATAGAACVAAVTLLVGGCSATNPITTQNNYAASDGTHAELGDLRLTNLIVLTAGEGEPGVVVGAVTSDGEAAEVSVVVDGLEAGSFRVPAGGTVLLGGEDGEQVELERVGVPVGTYLDLTVSSSVGTTTVSAPVLDGTLPEYAEWLPEGGSES